MEKLASNLEKELDFRLEADNARRLSHSFAGNRGVAVPRPIPQVPLMILILKPVKSAQR